MKSTAARHGGSSRMRTSLTGPITGRRPMGGPRVRLGLRSGTSPSAADLQSWFPDPWNADTWNLNAISPLIQTYSIGVGNYATRDVRPQYGAWFQDDWQIAPKLTLKLRARYDLSINANGNN